MLKEVLYTEQQKSGEDPGLPPPGPERTQVKSAARVLDILEHLARSDCELTLTEIATALGLPKSSTWLLLQTLSGRGYLELRSASGPFSLGPKVMELAGAYARKASLLQSFPAVARGLVQVCEETVQLAILIGVEVLYLAKEDGTRPVRLVSDTGKRLPAHATALGKVLLASFSDEELAEKFSKHPLTRLTPHTITSFHDLKLELTAVRSKGYAIDNEEVVEGLLCFAAPVRDAGGKVVAAMSVAVPKHRVGEGDADRYVGLIREAACELSRRIGYVDPVLG
jgi:DNA-binding IclR family transcriptional regulator